MAASILPSFDDQLDFQNSSRGLIASLEPCMIKDKSGSRIVWNNDEYKFLEGEACPDTAHPSLWRQAQLVSKQGLFQVTEGIYQIRGFDLSNITMIESTNGFIVIDPLVSTECAEAALNFFRTHRGNKPVSGLIYTHSHVDHFGGAAAVVAPNDNSCIPILAPEGFLEHAVSENIFAGVPMARRAVYMYGAALPKGPKAQLGCGLGTSNSVGTTTTVPPTVNIRRTGQEEIIDGIRIIFQLTPGTEAPSEMNCFFPDHRALCMAENATHTLHNILTLRGAQVRDAAAWSRYVDEAIVLFGNQSDVAFASHHWPTWGRQNIIQYLSEQRDLYGYLHDQTLRMMNQGLTGLEIAEEFALPDNLQRRWHLRGYYGSVSHNVKAIYQRYMGWYDGNPVHLWEHPPVEAAARYIQCMGGVERVLEKAQDFSQRGDHRFAATLLGHAVFAEPGNTAAKEALAVVFDRLAYGSENATWRNVYLTGAYELRHGPIKEAVDLTNPESLASLPVDSLLSSLACQLDGARSQHDRFTIELQFSDLRRAWQLILSNGVLTPRSKSLDESSLEHVQLSCVLTKEQLIGLITGTVKFEDLKSTGDSQLLSRLMSYIVQPNPYFPIVTP